MGIYDREYYRRDGASFLEMPKGQVCKALIFANIAAFFFQVTVPGFTDLFWLRDDQVLNGEVWRLFSYAFLHSRDTWTHIFFNMLFLWFFGSMVEELYGSREFLAIYLTAVLVGGVAFVAQSAVRDVHNPCVGASGAVTAVLVLAAIHYPHMTILLFFILPVPLWALAIFQVVLDTFLFLGARDTGVAVSVHLGGAGLAAVYYWGHWRILGFWDHLWAWKKRRSQPRLRVYRGEGQPEEKVSVPTAPLAEIDEQLEAKVDAVLEKVARFGQESLTDSERQILLRASEIYRKRRH